MKTRFSDGFWAVCSSIVYVLYVAVWLALLGLWLSTGCPAAFYLNNQDANAVNFIFHVHPQAGGTDYDLQWTVPSRGTLVVPDLQLVDAGPTQQITMQVYNADFSTDLTGNSFAGQFTYGKKDVFMRYLFGQIQIKVQDVPPVAGSIWEASADAPTAFEAGIAFAGMVLLVRVGLRWFKRAGTERHD